MAHRFRALEETAAWTTLLHPAGRVRNNAKPNVTHVPVAMLALLIFINILYGVYAIFLEPVCT